MLGVRQVDVVVVRLWIRLGREFQGVGVVQEHLREVMLVELRLLIGLACLEEAAHEGRREVSFLV